MVGGDLGTKSKPAIATWSIDGMNRRWHIIMDEIEKTASPSNSSLTRVVRSRGLTVRRTGLHFFLSETLFAQAVRIGLSAQTRNMTWYVTVFFTVSCMLA